MKLNIIMDSLCVLLLSIIIGIQGAVSEDSSKVKFNPVTNASSPQKEMQKYIQDLPKQKPLDTTTMKKYTRAQSAHYEDYQQSEEKKSDKIAMENNESIMNSSQLYRELIPFEISDAKMPDSETLKLIELSKEQKKEDDTNASEKKVKKDTSTAESILLKITHPIATSKQPRLLQELPLEVQNAINFFVQTENLQQLQAANKYKHPSANKYFSEKLKSQDTNKSWWLPSKMYFNNFAPLPIQTQSKQPTLFQTIPKINFNKLQTELQKTSAQKAQKEISKPFSILYAYETDYPIYSSLKQDIKSNQKYTSIISSEKLVTNGDPNLVELTSLIGKPADVQVHGLSEILKKQEKHVTEKPLIRPQDSTAPVLFPLGARLPNPRPQSEKPLYIVNAVSYSTTKVPDVTSTEPYTYVDIKSQNFKDTPLVSSPYFTTQDHIPISEHLSDINSNVTPPPSRVYGSPILEKGNEKNRFALSVNHSTDLQYASGYAFGYRVRDSHSGNDYGHTQNRDTDGVTRGEYHIRLPDGRVQNVKYTADEKGFHADVSYQMGIK